MLLLFCLNFLIFNKDGTIYLYKNDTSCVYFSCFDLCLVASICNNRVALSIFYTCWEMVVIFHEVFLKKSRLDQVICRWLFLFWYVYFFVFVFVFFFIFFLNWILYWMRKYAIRSPSNTTSNILLKDELNFIIYYIAWLCMCVCVCVDCAELNSAFQLTYYNSWYGFLPMYT